MKPIEFKKMKLDSWLTRAEAVIDAAMHAHESGDITIAASLFPYGTDFNRLLMRYKVDGWKCSYEFDSRDGDYLCFKEPE